MVLPDNINLLRNCIFTNTCYINMFEYCGFWSLGADQDCCIYCTGSSQMPYKNFNSGKLLLDLLRKINGHVSFNSFFHMKFKGYFGQGFRKSAF